MNEPSTTAAEMGIDSLIQQIDTSKNLLPEEALRSLLARREEAIPALIAAIRSACAQFRETGVYPGNASFFALILLTEFKAQQGLPAIVEAMSLPKEYPQQLFGDAISGIWPQALATLAYDQRELIDGLMEDRALDPYVRWGAVSSYYWLVQDGRLTRVEAVESLRHHLRCTLDQSILDQRNGIERDYDFATALVDELCNLRGAEARQELEEAFDQGLVDESLLDRNLMQAYIAITDAQFQKEMQRRSHERLDDSVAHLKTWAGFRTEEDWDTEDWDTDELEPGESEDEVGVDDWRTGSWVDDPAPPPPPPVGTIRAETRPGRNDPCPCNSGAKFKKCCGAPGKNKA